MECKYEPLTLQKFCEYRQKETKSSIRLVNAALTPYLNSEEETTIVAIVNGERFELCKLKPFFSENKLLDFVVNISDSLILFIEGENDIDLLIRKC